MNQILNICRKDALQLWPEILASFAILACFTVAEPGSWTSESVILFSMASAANVLAVLLCVCWGIIIIRLVQAERLVGANQFWTTRPYEWPKLMAAKALFLLLFLYAPLVLSQVFLLYRADLPIAGHMPLLFLNLILITTALVLPLTCFAAVTGSFAQASLAILGGLVFLAIMSYLDTPRFTNVAPLFLPLLQVSIEGGILFAVLLQQYSRRATRRSLVIFVAAPVLVLITHLALRGSSLAPVGYPSPTGVVPISIEFDRDPLRTSQRVISDDPEARLFIRVPLLVSQIAPGMSFSLHGQRITLTGANGYIWQSPWLSGGGGMLAPGVVSAASTSVADFSISRTDYVRLGEGALSMRLEFALAQLEDQPPLKYSVSTQGDRVPRLGFCQLDEGYFGIMCRSAFREPTYFAINSFRKGGPSCEDLSAPLYPAHGFVGVPDVAPTAMHISPILVISPRLNGASRGPATVCPGVPISYVEKRLKQRFQVQTVAVTIKLKDYTQSYKIARAGIH
jgi:hypothetical protein